MKKLFILLSIGLLLGVAYNTISCKKIAEHSIRVKNDSSKDYSSITIGPITFSNVKAASVTEYRSIPEGAYSLSGDVTTGEFDISGNGKHKWSIVISNGNPQNTIDLKED